MVTQVIGRVTFAVSVPLGLVTVQVCDRAVGCADTVTVYVVPLSTVARGTVPFADTATGLAPLVSTIMPEPFRPLTLPLMVKVVGPPDELLLELELELLLLLLLELEPPLLLELELELELELLLELELELLLVVVLSLLPPPQAATRALMSNDTTVRRMNRGADWRELLLSIIVLVLCLTNTVGSQNAWLYIGSRAAASRPALHPFTILLDNSRGSCEARHTGRE